MTPEVSRAELNASIIVLAQKLDLTLDTLVREFNRLAVALDEHYGGVTAAVPSASAAATEPGPRHLIRVPTSPAT
ncbi:hypothetical protein [Rhodococcus jostii]|uniref:hypothetical protein n=1 Tax=Rhodococcus jostii TaxID=132919 RepID=UPI00362B9F80